MRNITTVKRIMMCLFLVTVKYMRIYPVTMWENYGISSYIRGSAEQLIWQSYYLLEDTLKYEKPQVVIVNVLAMTQRDAKSEAYNRMTLDGMKLSKYKIASIRESMTEDENMASYIFPLLRYHSRWSELSSEDFRYMWKTPSVTTNGYLMQKGIRPVTTIPKLLHLLIIHSVTGTWSILIRYIHFAKIMVLILCL